MTITPHEALLRCIEHREIFHDEMLSLFRQIMRGELSPGAMIAANALMSRATQPLNVLVNSWRSVLGARDAFVRLEELLCRYPEQKVGVAGPAPSGRYR